MNKSAQTKIELLTANYSKYGQKYKEWKDKHFDDRRLYQNVYEILLDALKDMGKISNSSIWVAFNEYFHKELRLMDGIIERFAESEV